MKKMLSILFVLLGTNPLPAQTTDYFFPDDLMKSSSSRVFLDKQNNKSMSAKFLNCYSSYTYVNYNSFRNNIKNHRTDFISTYRPKQFNTSADNYNHISIWTEMGYVLAMETFFAGMSYLASRKNAYGPAITGSFDLFMGLIGLINAPNQKFKIQTTGYYLIAVGFITKALFNFRFAKNYNTNTRFITNFIGFNVLVFTGYFLDTFN